MNAECEMITDLIMSYLNHELNDKDRLAFLRHLASCQSCREELALILKLQKKIKQTVIEVPKDIKIHAYDKIKAQKSLSFDNMGSEITSLFVKTIPTPKTSLKVLAYVFGSVKKPFKLSLNH